MNDASKKRTQPLPRRMKLSGQPAGVSPKGLAGRSTNDRTRRVAPERPTTIDGVRYRVRTRSPKVETISPSPAPATAQGASDTGKSYTTGYCKPPKETQFKQGKSGNPRGRPRGSKNFSTILNEIMNRSLNVVVNGKPQRMSTTEALIEKILRVALEKGDLPKAIYLLSRVQENEARVAAIAAQRATAKAEPELTEADLAILADHRRELLLAHLGGGADVDELMQMLGLAQDAGPLSDAAGHFGPPTDEGAHP